MGLRKHALSELVALILGVATVIALPLALRSYHVADRIRQNRQDTISLVARNDNIVGQAGMWMVQHGNFWDYEDVPATSEITVRQGSEVALILTSVDTVHEFSLPEFEISTVVYPGKVSEIRFIADKPGTHLFECSNFCGEGHNEMRGTIIVLPELAENATNAVRLGVDS